MKHTLFSKPWQHLLPALLTLLLFVFYIGASHAATCTKRTITNDKPLPARSYTVDATPIQEVIATHTASVVWTGCTSQPLDAWGSWYAFFTEDIPVGTYTNGYDSFNTPMNIYGFDIDRTTNTTTNSFPVDSGHIRFRYVINCRTAMTGDIGFCVDDKKQVYAEPTNPGFIDYGLRMYVDLTWSATDVNKKGCLQVGGGKVGGGSAVTGWAFAKEMQVYAFTSCTNLRLDAKLTIVKTKPFDFASFPYVTTINLTKTGNFKYKVCEKFSSLVSSCVDGTPGDIRGSAFDLFTSGQPLTIKLTKDVRPIPPTQKCVVQLQSTPTRSRL